MTALIWLAVAMSLTQQPYVRDIGPGEVVRVLTVEQERALRGTAHPVTLARIGWCEGGLDASTWRIDTNGLPSVGSWQVQPRWWGEVPTSLAGQAQQADRILSEHGDRPWSAKECAEWTR